MGIKFFNFILILIKMLSFVIKIHVYKTFYVGSMCMFVILDKL